MKSDISFFSYKAGNSFLHKCPSWIKLLFIPVISIMFFFLPPKYVLFLILLQLILALALHFSLAELFTDLKPVLYYALLLIVAKIIPGLFTKKLSFWKSINWEEEKQTLYMLIKILCLMQSSSLMFKTSTPLELRQGIEKIETSFRKIFFLKKKNNFTNIIFMFLNFIPMISKIWNKIVRAWLIRGGKKGIKMYLVLLPVLFSCSLKKAYDLSRALAVRE